MTPAPVSVAKFVAGWWFAKSVGRAPTPRERSRFLWSYATIIALPFIAIALLAISKGVVNAPGLFILFLHYLPYPAFAQLFFSERYFAMAFKK